MNPAADPLDPDLAPPLVAEAGHRLRPWLLLPCGLALLAVLALFGVNHAVGVSVPLCAAGLALASAALLGALGYFDDPETPVASVALARLGLPLGLAATSLVGLVLAVRAAVAGALPGFLPSALLIPALFLALGATVVFSLRRLGALEIDESGERRPWRRRHGLWLLAGLAVVNLPGLGRSSLIDPWETHYGEVAREILARNDWISFWWAQDGFFWSKPALAPWLEALSFSLFGLPFAPDQLLSAAARGRVPEPEWAVRLPALSLSVIAVYVGYLAVRRGFGRRAGLLGALALATTPFWSLLAHQATTDMPYVAGVTCAVAFVALGLHTDARARVPSYRVVIGAASVRLGAAQGLFGLIALTSLAQIVYLASRHLVLGAGSVALRSDVFWAGSGGGLCAQALPGNEACQEFSPVHAWLQPGLMACVWSAALVVLLVSQRRERRAQRLWFLAAWYALSLAALAKGAPGLVLPLAISAGYLAISGRGRELARLELPALCLTLACVALPWYAQAYARHGGAFFDRLFRHDMYDRAFLHVHDTNAGDDVSVGYYLWQLGYGLFPWTGLAVTGLFVASAERPRQDARAGLGALLLVWFALCFALFSAALTKYHHYILPAVVPAALLAGIALDRCFEGDERGSVALGLAGLFTAGLVVLVGRDLTSAAPIEGQARLMHLFVYNYARPWPDTLDLRAPIWLAGVGTACASALFVVPRLRRASALAVAAIAVAFSVFVLGVYLPAAAPHYGQRELLLEYYSRRASPREPLVAYQLNWKGENFYSGNQVAAFATTGDAFQVYLRKLRERGTRALFVMAEHRRLGALKSELGVVRRFQRLTRPALNNKFFLARVEL